MTLIILLLALLGVSETSFLIRQRRRRRQPICLGPDRCQLVLDSQYNKFFGFHQDVLGLIFYCTLVVLATSPIVFSNSSFLASLALTGLIASGAIYSSYLIYLQWQKINHWCLWCLVSSLTIFAMASLTLPPFIHSNI